MGDSEEIDGNYLQFWHDTIAFGVEPFYARVLKVSPKTALVRTETGDIKRIPLERAIQHLIGNDQWHPEIPLTSAQVA